jgi:hypothetical protein
MKRTLTFASGLLLITLTLVGWLNMRQPQPVELVPTLTGQTEYCLTCHSDVQEISPSHPVKAFGCVLCHGGERLALDADLAHNTMRGEANPSDLLVVETSCGGSNCHTGSEADQRDHIQRVMTSIQATYAGAIANIRFTFGAQSDLAPIYGIEEVVDEQTETGINSLLPFDLTSETNPSVLKFGENCLTCHLRAEPPEGDVFDRQTGCASCHVTETHTFTTAIPYTQCNTCHNRGNYDLRTLTFVERADHPTQRIDDYYQPIGVFTKCEYTLDCVDCHTRTEAMGDGDIHADQKNIEYVRCATCHGTPTKLPLIKTLTDPNDIAFRLIQLNPVVDLQLGDTIIVTEQGEPLWNTRVLTDGTYEMVGKATHQYFTFRPVMGSGCTQNGQDQNSSYCHECHAVEK